MIMIYYNQMDPFIVMRNQMKRNKVLDTRKYTSGNNPNTYDMICPLCNIKVSYENTKHEKNSKKHIMALQKYQTNELRETSPIMYYVSAKHIIN